MNKRIALLTLPLQYNYGGIMQCFALQTVLERMGCEVSVLNRRHGRPRLTLMLLLLRCLSVLKCVFRRYVLGQKHWLVIRPWAAVYEPDARLAHKPSDRRHVQAFVREHIHLTQPMRSTRALRRWADAHPVDAFVVGSDQVWRGQYAPSVTDCLLGFLPDADARPRVAYAASFGTEPSDIAPALLPRCASLARRFRAVSVREHSGVRLARTLFGVEAQWVLDPTLLLTASDYQMPSPAGTLCWQGVVTYILDPSAPKHGVAADVARALGQPLHAITLGPRDEEGLPAELLPVEEWLHAFRQAHFVVTDSFHGCVFSIIHRKPFIALANRERGLDRFTSLLGSLDLTSRLLFSTEEYMPRRASLLAPIDYAPVAARLQEARESSLSFLRDALGLDKQVVSSARSEK